MVYTVIRAKFVTPSQFRSSVKYIKLVHLQPSQKFVQLFQPLLGGCALTDVGPRLCILNGLMDWPKIQLERPAAAVCFYFCKANKIENRQVVTRSYALRFFFGK